MTTNIFTAPPTNATDAEFRLWGKGLSDALAAVGMVKTSDTGQVNWTTVLKPPALNTYQGYEIWRFNDTLQATKPLFLKVECGAGANIVAWPSMKITLGKSSDGAGTIGGQFASAAFTPNASSSTAMNWYVSSGDGSMLAIAPAPGLAQDWSFWVDRSRAVDGTATGTAVAMTWTAGNSVVNIKMANYASGVAITNTSGQAPCAIPYTTTGLTVSPSNIPVYPLLLTDGVGTFWQPRAVVVGHSSDIGSLASFVVQGLGTYMPIPTMNSYSGSSIRGAILWS